ncbi:GlxA family transcriptional regulator [Rhizobium sp. LCM 4573]|uniref:GlxA family transcriptional regulator n=1 Tax=Rhizobium sp. LCM 4573 TaxID=1848291 RepID=UPI0008DADFBB|nr:GlxA family transcriptional regulator [Rhizobium sp. LCM 4573]OHV76703.1 AraC family transcriptional regulator [Rhizobium sp. LCM 4573]
MTAEPPEIGIIDYEGAQQAAVLGMTDLIVFAERRAREKAKSEQPLLRLSHWRLVGGETGEPARIFDTAPTSPGRPTFLLVPPGLGAPLPQEMTARYAQWLRVQHSEGTALGSVCNGAFLLGETGLLSRRKVTTHWTYEEPFLSRFPEVELDTDRLIVDDGDIVTAGGIMAWIDLCLKLIDRFLGPTIMVETARTFLVDPPGREQSYYSAFAPKLNHGDAAILKVQHWLQATEGKQMSLAALAAQAGLQERTFIRRFQKATGLTTGDYIQRLRVNKARELLQFTKASVDQVAWEVGYTDPSAFRKIFGRIVGLTPQEYRQRFAV